MATTGSAGSARARLGRWARSRPAALLLAAAAAGSLWLRSPAQPCGDFCSYYAAGGWALSGEPEAAYDPARLEARHRATHDLHRRAGPFLYSPLYLAPSALLARLPLAAAQRANRALGAVALGAGLAALLLLLDRALERLAVAAAFALAHAAWVQLAYANWSFLLFALLAGAALALARGRPLAAGLAAAAAIHLKAFALFALAGPALGRGRRAVGWTALAGALLVALSLAASGVEPWRRFGAFLAGRPAAGVTPYYSKSSLAANLARTATEPREWLAPRRPVATFAVRAAFWAGLPLLAWGAWRLRAEALAAFGFGAAWLLLFVPQVWEHTEILLFLALPGLAPRWRWAFVALLAATFFYNDVQQELLREVLRGERPPGALRALLWLYPSLALLAQGALLASAPRRAAAEG
jgi:hypothetical protein